MSVAEFIGLFLYLAQQFGMGLGIGGMAVFLMLSAKDPQAEALSLARIIVRRSLWLVIASGVLITVAHIIAGEGGVIFEPAFVFKWLLVIILLFFTFVPQGHGLGEEIVDAVSGGTWFALFALHTLAPVASWIQLLMFYGAWMGLFVLCYVALVRPPKEAGAPVQQELPPMPVTQPRPVISAPVVQPRPVPPPPLVQTPRPVVPVAPPTPIQPHAPITTPVRPTPAFAATPTTSHVSAPAPAPAPLPRPVQPATPVPPPQAHNPIPQTSYFAPRPQPAAAMPPAPQPAPQVRPLPQQSVAYAHAPVSSSPLPPPPPPPGGQGLSHVTVMPRGPQDLQK